MLSSVPSTPALRQKISAVVASEQGNFVPVTTYPDSVGRATALLRRKLLLPPGSANAEATSACFLAIPSSSSTRVSVALPVVRHQADRQRVHVERDRDRRVRHRQLPLRCSHLGEGAASAAELLGNREDREVSPCHRADALGRLVDAVEVRDLHGDTQPSPSKSPDASATAIGASVSAPRELALAGAGATRASPLTHPPPLCRPQRARLCTQSRGHPAPARAGRPS